VTNLIHFSAVFRAFRDSVLNALWLPASGNNVEQSTRNKNDLSRLSSDELGDRLLFHRGSDSVFLTDITSDADLATSLPVHLNEEIEFFISGK
jgi:hypothetical protein